MSRRTARDRIARPATPRPVGGHVARDRALTWFYTGPLGHFVAGFADWVTLLSRFAWAKARGRSLS